MSTPAPLRTGSLAAALREIAATWGAPSAPAAAVSQTKVFKGVRDSTASTLAAPATSGVSAGATLAVPPDADQERA